MIIGKYHWMFDRVKYGDFKEVHIPVLVAVENAVPAPDAEEAQRQYIQVDVVLNTYTAQNMIERARKSVGKVAVSGPVKVTVPKE